MNSFSFSELTAGMFFSEDVMLDKNFILLNSMTPLTESLVKALTDWDFKQVFSTGLPVKSTNIDDESVSRADVKSIIAEVSAETSWAGEKDTREREAQRLETVKKMYGQYIDYVNTVYTRFATHKELDFKALSQNMQDMCVFVKENNRYILRLTQLIHPHDTNFIIVHSLRSTIVAIAIGLQLRLALGKLSELGIACMLHELGMLKLPPQLYMTDKSLTLGERKSLSEHPLLAYEILKSYSFPLSICQGVLEHHEKENGSGYPQKLDGSKISLYAKIIAVACFFESMTAGRQYKEPQNSNAAMVELLKNTGKQYDEGVIKALLYSLSLFPLGTYVYLSDGRIGMSVEVNPIDPKNPVIELINETDEHGAPKLVQPGGRDLSITRALTENELTDFRKSLSAVKETTA